VRGDRSKQAALRVKRKEENTDKKKKGWIKIRRGQSKKKGARQGISEIITQPSIMIAV